MADKRIRDLQDSSGLQLSDFFATDRTGALEATKETIQNLLDLVQSNISTGLGFTTGTANPDNTNGNDGDVYFKITANRLDFYQKSGGSWSSVGSFIVSGGGSGGGGDAFMNALNTGNFDITGDFLVNGVPLNIDSSDRKISGGGIDVSGFPTLVVQSTEYTLTVGGVQQVYSMPSAKTFTGIALSATGKQRFVAFYGNASNTVIKVEGTESEAAGLPDTPTDTTYINSVIVTDAVIVPPNPDLTGFGRLGFANTWNAINEFKGGLKVTTYGGQAQITFHRLDGTQLGYLTQSNNPVNNDGRMQLGLSKSNGSTTGFLYGGFDALGELFGQFFCRVKGVAGVDPDDFATVSQLGGGGGGGSNLFADLTDDPRDNALLDAELDDKVDKVTGRRLITSGEATVLGNTSGTNTGDETPTTLGATVNGADAKNTPVDADMIPLMDSADSNVLKKLSWLNVKATLKTWLQSTAFAISAGWNFTGTLKKSGVDVATTTDLNLKVDKSALTATGEYIVTAKSDGPHKEVEVFSLLLGVIDDTVPATSSSLNTSYPAALIGQRVEGNAGIYEKKSSTIWRYFSAPLV